MNLFNTDEFREFVEIHSDFRKKAAYMALSNRTDDELVKDLKKEIQKFNFIKERVKFDFSKLELTPSDVANEICMSSTGLKYTDVYAKIYGATKRGYKIQNQPSDLIELICDAYGCQPSDFIKHFDYEDFKQ